MRKLEARMITQDSTSTLGNHSQDQHQAILTTLRALSHTFSPISDLYNVLVCVSQNY